MTKSYVRDEKGRITHIRETSEDGTQSYLYEYDNSFFGTLKGGKGAHVEVADHRDGETQAYEVDNSFSGSLFKGGRGKAK